MTPSVLNAAMAARDPLALYRAIQPKAAAPDSSSADRTDRIDPLYADDIESEADGEG